MIDLKHFLMSMAVMPALLGQPAKTASPIACNMHALSTIEREQHAVMSRRLLEAVKTRRALRGGYSFELNKARISFSQVAEWVEKEQRCCPFFDFRVEHSRENGPLSLTLTGRKGVKRLIETVLL